VKMQRYQFFDPIRFAAAFPLRAIAAKPGCDTFCRSLRAHPDLGPQIQNHDDSRSGSAEFLQA
jgi:hypothetical protein